MSSSYATDRALTKLDQLEVSDQCIAIKNGGTMKTYPACHKKWGPVVYKKLEESPSSDEDRLVSVSWINSLQFLIICGLTIGINLYVTTMGSYEEEMTTSVVGYIWREWVNNDQWGLSIIKIHRWKSNDGNEWMSWLEREWSAKFVLSWWSMRSEVCTF